MFWLLIAFPFTRGIFIYSTSNYRLLWSFSFRSDCDHENVRLISFMNTATPRITSLPKDTRHFEFKRNRRARRLTEQERDQKERSVLYITSILNISHRCFTENDKDKGKSAKSVGTIVLPFNCQIYDVLITIVFVKAPPYYPLLCVACQSFFNRINNKGYKKRPRMVSEILIILRCTMARISYQLYWDLGC